MNIDTTKLAMLAAAANATFKILKNANDLATAAFIDHTAAMADFAAYATTGEPATAPPATTPVNDPPASAKITLRADTQDELAKAIAAGAALIETNGLVLTGSFDLKGATLVGDTLAPGEKWHAVVELQGTAKLSNATIEAPNRKAILSTGVSTVIENVTTASANYCLHVNKGECSAKNFRTADTYKGYGVFLDDATYLAMSGGYVGSSDDESSFRSTGGRADLRGGLIINALLSKAVGCKVTALRGDFAPRPDGTYGLTAKGCIFFGLVAPNPLDDDAAELMGVMSWPLANNQTAYAGQALKPQLIALAQSLYAAGKSIGDIAAAVYLKAFGMALPLVDLAATLAERKRSVGRVSTALIESCTINGWFRLAARATVTVRACAIDTGGVSLFAMNSTPVYPLPAYVFDKTEVGPPPSWSIEGSTLKANGLGVDPATYPLALINGKPLSVTALAA